MGYDAQWESEKPADYIRIAGTFVGQVVEAVKFTVQREGKPSVDLWGVLFRVGALLVRGSFWDQDRSYYWTVNLFKAAGLTKEEASGNPGDAWARLVSKGGVVAFSTKAQKNKPDFFEVDVRSVRKPDAADDVSAQADYGRALAEVGADSEDCPF